METRKRGIMSLLSKVAYQLLNEKTHYTKEVSSREIVGKDDSFASFAEVCLIVMPSRPVGYAVFLEYLGEERCDVCLFNSKDKAKEFYNLKTGVDDE